MNAKMMIRSFYGSVRLGVAEEMRGGGTGADCVVFLGSSLQNLLLGLTVVERTESPVECKRAFAVCRCFAFGFEDGPRSLARKMTEYQGIAQSVVHIDRSSVAEFDSTKLKF
eukprot:TRINITY_DN28359_c1_g1_i1.p1 TRINITY_DN28359_c1_g1~~TRINITY_DN28359_c1_g1_i1.p1  ORF type:complete len:112 (-),score=3.22 TRINITY_DN28359_c1_g1_i1:17-352(-)